MKYFDKLPEKKQRIQVFCLMIVLLFFMGGASGSSIITGTKRPSIDPSEVKIFLELPTQYETIGIIEASSDVEFSRQSAQNRVINKLKSKAAKVGANGVVLINSGSQQGGTTGFYSNGFFYGETSSIIIAQGKAIYVIQEWDVQDNER